MSKYRIWERAVYKAREIESPNMYSAVRKFVGVPILKLTGDPALSTKSNTVRFIDSLGTAREFTAYEVHE